MYIGARDFWYRREIGEREIMQTVKGYSLFSLSLLLNTLRYEAIHDQLKEERKKLQGLTEAQRLICVHLPGGSSPLRI